MVLFILLEIINVKFDEIDRKRLPLLCLDTILIA